MPTQRAMELGLGSPPRVRSRRDGQVAGGLRQRGGRMGITSACAEQTNHTVGYGKLDGDHLRVCGADFLSMASAASL